MKQFIFSVKQSLYTLIDATIPAKTKKRPFRFVVL